MENTLNADHLRRIYAYWRAANYLSVGQIYLYASYSAGLAKNDIKPCRPPLGNDARRPAQTFLCTL